MALAKLQRLGQAQADSAIRGDGEGEVAERFVTGTVCGDPGASTFPVLLPLHQSETRSVRLRRASVRRLAPSTTRTRARPGRLQPAPVRRADAATALFLHLFRLGWVPLHLAPPRVCSSAVTVSPVGAESRFSMVAIAARNPMMWWDCPLRQAGTGRRWRKIGSATVHWTVR